MLRLAALLQMQFDDPADVACGGIADAESLALWLALASLPAVALAWKLRARVATAGHQGLWAAIALLAGVAQVLVALYRVPFGCLSGHALTTFVGCASPWLVAAGIFYGAVAPTPPALRPEEPRASRDPFA